MSTAEAGTAPRESIVQHVLAVDPNADAVTVENAVAAVVDTIVRHRRVVRALADRPEVLRDGRPPAPQALGELLLLLRRTGAAALAAPACRGCCRPLSSVRGGMVVLRWLPGSVSRMCRMRAGAPQNRSG